MRISEGMGRMFGAGLLAAALLLPLPAAAPTPAFARDDTGATLDLLRQFHSYAPARHASAKRRERKQEKLRAALDHARGLRFTEHELRFLQKQERGGVRIFSDAFIAFLRDLALPPYELSVEGDQYRLAFEGKWVDVELWETIALAIISELYAASLMERMAPASRRLLYERAHDRLSRSLEQLRRYPNLRFSDFGTRRRHSFVWHNRAIVLAKQMLGEQFAGTSNVLLAMRHNLVPIGTNAHSLQMATMAPVFDELYRAGDFNAIIAQQYELLLKWERLFPNALRIMLPDTYGSAQFFAGASEHFARKWLGVRQDSGDPFAFGEMVLAWYARHGVRDPKAAGKVLIFSDGLTAEKMVALWRAFSDRINVMFGWGTHFTNGFDGLHPDPDELVPGLSGARWGAVKWAFSLVCKVVAAGGHPAVKLPDNLEKATGPKNERERYLQVFGKYNRTQQNVIV